MFFKKEIIIITTLFIFIIGGFFIFNYNKQPNESNFIEITPEEEFSDWQTHQSKSFQFKYPPTWKIVNENKSSVNPDKNLKEEIILEQTSGEWIGDTITISYITGNKITDFDSKFGSITYYYDFNSEQWMQFRISEMTGQNKSGLAEIEMQVNNLPVFLGTGRWLTYIIPLSHTEFLKLNISRSGETEPLKNIIRTVKPIEKNNNQEVDVISQFEINEKNKALAEEILSTLILE